VPAAGLCRALQHGGPRRIEGFLDAASDKIRRIRGAERPFSPYPLLTGGAVAAAKDPWIKTLAIAAAGCAAITLALFIVYKVALSSGVSSLADLASLIRQ